MLLLRSQTTQPSSILGQAEIRSERGFLHNRILPIARRLARQRWLSKPQRRYSEASALLRKYPDSQFVQLQIWSPDPGSDPSLQRSGGQGAFDPHHTD